MRRIDRLAIGILTVLLLVSCADKKQLSMLRSAEGDRHWDKGAYEQAMAAYQEAIRLYPERIGAYVNLARVHAALEQYEPALEVLEKALQVDPQHDQAHLLLGEVHLARGEYQESLAALERATGLAPGDLRASLGKGLAHLGAAGWLAAPVPPGVSPSKLIDYLDAETAAEGPIPQDALEQFGGALELAGEGKTAHSLRWFLAHLHLLQADGHRKRGEYPPAIAAYQACVRLDPAAVRTETDLTVQYGYDADGNVNQRVDANGDTTRYAYDPLGRLVEIAYPEGSTVGFEYDAVGSLLSLKDATGQTSFTYDRVNRLTAAKFPNGMTLRYAHDAAGRVGEVYYPDGKRVAYEYDAEGRLTRVADTTGVTTYAYSVAGDLLERVLPNGVRTRYAYDGTGRSIGAEHYAVEELILAYRYRLDATGRPIYRQRVSPADTLIVEYGYDKTGRPVEERYSDGRHIRYAYDAAGNRLKRVASGDTVEYVYGRDHRLRLAGNTWFEYDRNGNLTARITPEGEVHYRYDYENRLVRVEGSDAQLTFQYRGDGQRWAREGAEEKTYDIAGADGKMLMRVDAAGDLRDVQGPGEELIGGKGGGYLYDRSGGDPVALCDSSGAVQARWDYGIFGEVVAAEGQAVHRYGFKGGSVEPAAGLVYLQGRYYDPSVGRFLTPARSEQVPLFRFRNPYGDLEFSFGGVPPQESLLRAADWGGADPFVKAVKEVLRGQYSPPIDATPPLLSPLEPKSVLGDSRLPPLLTPAVIRLWGEPLVRPGREQHALRLPFTAATATTSLHELSTRVALAHIQHRWRWEPGQRQDHLASTAGIIYSAGGLLDVQGGAEERDLSTLDGFDELFSRDFVPQDSTMYQIYRTLIDRAAQSAVASDEFEAFLEDFPEGSWTPQVQLLLGRQLLREGRAARADSLYAAMAEELFDPAWGDDILIAQMLVKQERQDPKGARKAYERLLHDFPESEWRDDALYVLGRTLQEAGQSAAALDCFAQFAEGFPESVWTDENIFKQPLANYFRQITRITSALFDPVSRQLILSGENDPSLPPFDMDDFVVALRAIYQQHQDPAVSIGTESSNIPNYKKVRYDGGTVGTSFGRTMFAADYALKTLSIGRDSTRTTVALDLEDYKSAVDWTLELDPLVVGAQWNSRVWFVPGKVEISKTADGSGILIDEIIIVVQSESKFFGRSGNQAGLEAFAGYLTDHYANLADRYASIRRLPQLAKLVAIAKWMRDHHVPVDLSWMDSYRLKEVETPDLVKTSSTERRKDTGGTWGVVRLVMEGGVSFREPNAYEVDDAQVAEMKTEVLVSRPRHGDRDSWTFQAAGKEHRAVGVVLGRSRRDGQLALAHTDLQPVVGRAGPQLTRYYGSFDIRSGSFGRGWSAVPYALQFRRELTGASGETGRVEEGMVAVLEDRLNGRYEPYAIGSHFAFSGGGGQRLRRSFDGTLALTQTGGGKLDFDAEGRLTGITDRSGNHTFYRYQEDRLVAIADSSGREIHLYYDGEGRVAQGVAPGGGVVHYRYDESGDLVRVETPDGQQLAYRYSADHRLVQGDLGTPQSFQVFYDPAGRVRAFQDGEGHAVAFDYDLNTYQTTAVDRQGQVYTREFDETYRMRREVDAQEQGVALVYTPEGDLEKLSSASGYSLDFAYSQDGDLIELRGPLGDRFRLDYNQEGLAVVQDPNGLSRGLIYDRHGRLVEIADDAKPQRDVMGKITGFEETAHSTELSYNQVGLLAGVTNAGGQTFRLERDDAGNLLRVSGGDGRLAEVEFDSLSRITQLTDAAGRSIDFTHDRQDRLTRVGSAAGEFVYEYDAQGRLLRITGPDGAITSLEYEGGKLARVRLADGGTVEYLYGEDGRLIGTVDPDGERLVYEYDASGQAVKITSLPPEN
jgi:RHS repeat-associated protein